MKKKVLILTAILIAAVTIFYSVAAFLARPAILMAHTPFTFSQIIRIQQNCSFVSATSDSWTKLSEEELDRFSDHLD